MPVLADPPHPYRSLSPYLVTPTPQAVVDFATGVLGATEVEAAMRWPDGTIAHVALAIGDSVLMVGCTEARDQTQTAMLHVYVGDCDAAYQAALAGNFSIGFSVLGVRSTVVPLLVVQGMDLAPGWIGAAFAALWMTNLVTAVMAKEDDGVSMVKSTNIVIRLIKLVRDYGFIIVVIALALIWPGLMWIVLLGFGAVNALFLLASIASNARASLR